MGRRAPAGGRTGGGEDIPAPREAHGRLVTAGLSFATLLTVVGSLPVRADRLGVAFVAAGGLAAALLLAGLVFRWAGPLPWAYAVAGAAYTGFLFVHGGTIDPVAPLYAGALVLSAELAYWSLDRPVHGAAQGRRASLVVTACLAGGGIGGLVLSVSELAVRGGLGLEILGVAAAVASLALIARLARPE